jgi:hypothetical protein
MDTGNGLCLAVAFTMTNGQRIPDLELLKVGEMNEDIDKDGADVVEVVCREAADGVVPLIIVSLKCRKALRAKATLTVGGSSAQKFSALCSNTNSLTFQRIPPETRT